MDVDKKFGYALTLTRSRLGLLPIHFCKFITELWILIIVRISFLLSILGTNRWNQTKFFISVDVGQIYVGIATIPFLQLYNRVMALGYCQKFVSAQYFLSEVMEFDQIVHMC